MPLKANDESEMHIYPFKILRLLLLMLVYGTFNPKFMIYHIWNPGTFEQSAIGTAGEGLSARLRQEQADPTRSKERIYQSIQIDTAARMFSLAAGESSNVQVKR